MVNALIDYLNAPGVVPLQRVVDNFDGDTLNERWTLTEQGSGTGVMDDNVDGGWKYTTASTTADNGVIDFNNIRHYEPSGFVLTAIAKRVTATDAIIDLGLREDSSFSSYIIAQNDTADTYINLTTNDTSSTVVNTSIVVDTNWHEYKLTGVSASSVTLHVDGVLEAISTVTADIPTVRQQPMFRVYTRAAAQATGHIRYLEAYNT